MDVVVLGGGVIGVTTAWYLRQQGHHVRLIERRGAAAMETSFANAGQVSAQMAEPWANPTTLKTLSSWLFNDQSPLVFRPKASWAQWSWLLQFLSECRLSKYQYNLKHLVSLGLYSRQALQELRQAVLIDYDHKENGILLFFTEQASFDKAAQNANHLRQFGVQREVVSAEQCLSIEPSLHSQKAQLVGGLYSKYDETGDAHKFTQALAQQAAQEGVVFSYDTHIEKIQIANGDIDSLVLRHTDGTIERLRADRYVMCLGPSTARMARDIGISLPIYPIKGYSLSIPLESEEVGCNMGLTDAAHKIAYSRLGNRLRATAYAEITDYDLGIDAQRCDAIQKRTEQLFPHGLNWEQTTKWAGLRPMTPSNLPYIGKTKYPALYINAGHGTIGWTQSCGSAKAIAEIISGHTPSCEFPFK